MYKIGLLTYHAVCNFGANCQALSTISYFKKNGMDIEIINWQPDDLREYYKKTVPEEQIQEHDTFVDRFLPTSPLLKTLEEIQAYLKQNIFDAIIVGSDAVFNYHPILTRIYPSKKQLVKYVRPTSDHIFPNPFWGCFDSNAKLFALSACAQALNYGACLPFEKKRLRQALAKFGFISVRDRWAKMIMEKLMPQTDIILSPDPVFGLNANCPGFITDDVIDKYELPSKYVIFSFLNKKYFDKEWFNSLYEGFREQGFSVVNLAMPEGCLDIKSDLTINTPLPVQDWYNIIRLSSGYIGQRMHPMIVAMVNNVPVFIFDHYVIRGTNNLDSSKIYDLLERADMLECYVNLDKKVDFPTSEIVNIINNFDLTKEYAFVKEYEKKYEELMSLIVAKIVADEPKA